MLPKPVNNTKIKKEVIKTNRESIKIENVSNKKINEWPDNDVSKWSNQDVDKWFHQIKLEDSHIYRILCPCNGELLTQLYEFQQFSPEFFIKSISNSDSNLYDLKTAAVFALSLKKLFRD